MQNHLVWNQSWIFLGQIVHRCLPSGPTAPSRRGTERPFYRLPSDPPSSASHGRLEVTGEPGSSGSLRRLTFKKSFMNEVAERKTIFKDGGRHIRRAGRAPLGSGATSGSGLKSEDRKPAFPATNTHRRCESTCFWLLCVGFSVFADTKTWRTSSAASVERV